MAQEPINLIPAPIALEPSHRQNFMYALMTAVGKDQDSMSMQQIVDSKTTMIDASIENAMYNHYNQILQNDAEAIQKVPEGQSWTSDEINKLQAQYNVDSSTAQSNESQQDGMVQSGQGQTSTDASNLQMKAQMLQAVNGIQSALTNMLGQVVA
ncbi:MAG: hypothetical protein JSS30_06365 [Verrucomicrobia bacterium]|nr:hypothetical protein [Verrucomicrobiota bacterium]